MQIDIKLPLILALAQLVQKCVCTCNCSSICECIDMRKTALYYCPNQTNSFVKHSLSYPDSKIQITCENPKINHSLYIPSCDWSRYRQLTINYCNVQSLVNKLFQNIKSENLSYLRILDATNGDNLIDNDVFKSMPNLKEMYLIGKGGGIRVSNDILFHTRKLTKLRFYLVNLKDKLISFDYVPDLIRYLSKLTYLNLSHNNLTTLTWEMLVGLHSIDTLDFRVNAISFIAEDTFSNLSNLTELDLSKNKITKLPKNLFANNTKLKKLWLSDNFLTVIPDQLFRNCINLKRLELDSLTQLEYLPEKLFYNNNSLQELNLDNCNLNEYSFPKTFFSNLKWLNGLTLSDNKFKKIDMSLFNNVSTLSRLDLSSNLITTVKVVQLLSSAKKIFLKNNQISKVDFRLIDTVKYQQPELIRIYLQNNPIACNCSNYDLYLFINKKCFGNLTNAIQFDSITSNCPNKVSFANFNNISCPISHCPSGCSCSFSPEENVILINCASINMTKMPDRNSFTKLTDFQWFKSYLMQTFEAEFPNCIKMKVMINLNLSGNLIEVVDYVPANLKYLDLSGNRIRRIDVDIVQQLINSSTLMKVLLHDNPWDCVCGMPELGQLVILKSRDSSEVYCENSQIPLSIITQVTPCSNRSNIIAAITVCLGFLLCLTAILAIYYRFQTRIKIFLFNRDLCLRCITENDIDPDKTYDVFISFSHEDEQFVIEHLLPGLETSKTPYKVCIHTRDWVPGDFIVEQIVRSVSESRRTLVVLSNSFVNSDWGKMEFRTAHTKAINEGKTRVIVVLYGQLDENQLDDTLKNYIQTNTYVKWGDKYFWEKLRYALPHSLRFIESNKKLVHHSITRKSLEQSCINEIPELVNVTNKPSSVILNPNTLREQQIICS